MIPEIIEIHWTCANKEEAQLIIQLLIEKRLIACAQMSQIESIYEWKGVIETSIEYKIVFKTQCAHFHCLQKIIEMHCTYEIPQIVCFKIEAANRAYVEWVINATS